MLGGGEAVITDEVNQSYRLGRSLYWVCLVLAGVWVLSLSLTLINETGGMTNAVDEIIRKPFENAMLFVFPVLMLCGVGYGFRNMPDPSFAVVEAIGALMAFTLAAVMALISLLIAYGVIMLIFRHAFGVELPNPFDWLPTEWQEPLRSTFRRS